MKRIQKFAKDTTCERFPRLLCGAGCSAVEGEEECHTKVVDNLIIMMRKYIN